MIKLSELVIKPQKQVPIKNMITKFRRITTIYHYPPDKNFNKDKIVFIKTRENLKRLKKITKKYNYKLGIPIFAGDFEVDGKKVKLYSSYLILKN